MRGCLQVTRPNAQAQFSLVVAGAPDLCSDYRYKLDRDAKICTFLSLNAICLWWFCNGAQFLLRVVTRKSKCDITVWMMLYDPDDGLTSTQKKGDRTNLVAAFIMGPFWFFNMFGAIYTVRLFTMHSQQSIRDFAQAVRTEFSENETWMPTIYQKVGALEETLTTRLKITQQTWGFEAVAMLFTAFILTIITIHNLFDKASELFDTEGYWVLPLWEIAGLLPTWFVWITSTLYFLARVTDVANTELGGLKKRNISASEELRAYADELIAKGTINMKLVKQTWSIELFYGAMMTIVLALVFVWLQSEAESQL